MTAGLVAAPLPRAAARDLHVHDPASARAALIDPRLSRSGLRSCPARPLEGHVLNRDGADHRRHRAALAGVLEARGPVGLRQVRPLVHGLLRDLDGPVDLAAALVRPFAVLLVDALLGLSEGSGRPPSWWLDVVGAVERRPSRALLLGVQRTLADLVRTRRAAPADDAVSLLLADGRLDDDEVVDDVFFLLSAGTVNTGNLLGAVLLALAGSPEQYRRLQARPQDAPRVVEELLRGGPASRRASVRVAAQPAELGGLHVEAGDRVWVHRDGVGETPGLPFGAGPHHCPSAGFARSALDLALLALLEQVDGLAPLPATPLAWDVLEPLPLHLRRAARPGVPTAHRTDDTRRTT